MGKGTTEVENKVLPNFCQQAWISCPLRERSPAGSAPVMINKLKNP